MSQDLSIKYGNGENEFISFKTKNASIVGENGSGKSTLMRKIKKINSNSTIISAQKNLTIQQGQFRAQDDNWLQENKSHFRGPNHNGNSPIDNNNLQEDFNHIIEFIFREYTDQSVQAVNTAIDTGKPLLGEIQRKLDKVINIWNSIFPDKILLYESKKIRVKSQDSLYDIETLSDGERCALYILIKVILSGETDVIIIDEPETFLNPALLNQLFDECEKLKPNASFIYFSHDLEFVTTRKNNTIFWIKNYKYPEEWDIQEISVDNIPDELIIKVIGSKKEKILFVESEENKDAQLYQLIYPEFKVWPVGGGENVISYTKAFNSGTENFNKQYFGLVDRDLRTENEIASLEVNKIFAIPTAIYEGLFLRKEIIEFVFIHLGRKDFEQKYSELEQEVKSKQRTDNYRLHYIKSMLNDKFSQEIDNVAKTGTFQIEIAPFHQQLSDMQKFNNVQILEKLNQKEIKSCTSIIGYTWNVWHDHVLNILSNTSQSENFRTKFIEFMPSISS